MMNHLIVVLLMTTSGMVAQPSRLPNIDYLGDGYDVVHGNPHENLFDRGFRQPIFRLDYATESVSADGKWLLPDHVEARQARSCSFDAESREITGTSSYSDSLMVDASVEFGIGKKGGKGFEFSASTEYNKIRQNTQSNHMVYTSATAKCSRYVAYISRRTAVNLTDPFIRSVQDLPLTPDKESYLEFISVFGTHYVSQMTMGAKFVITTEFDENSWASFEQEGLSITAAAKVNLLVFSAGANMATSKQTNMSNAFESKRNSRTESYLGSRPPADGKWETWAATAGNHPYPISYVLAPLTDLLKSAYFPGMGLANLRTKRNNLNSMYSAYCSSIENCGMASADRVPMRMDAVRTNMRGVQRVICRPGFKLLSCGLYVLDASTKDYDVNR